MKRPSNRALARLGLFAALVGVELYLARSMSATPSIRGYVDTKSYGVSSASRGLVRRIDVALGQSVTAGQMIAEIDPGSVDNEIAVAMAERKRLIAVHRTGSGASEPDEALVAIDTRLEQLQSQRDAMRLKSPVDGIVESLEVHPGDAIGPNSPVATVVIRDTRRVIACIPESRFEEAEVGRATEIHSLVGGRSYTGVVESVTPAIAPLPPRCQQPLVRIPEVGRVAVVLLDDSADLVPGQTQLIAFSSEHRALPATEAPPTATRSPAPLDVPSELASLSRFEPSGLVWVPALDRYVVVSDETGTDRARPWLFTMSRHGVLDPEPLVIEGLGELDDVESIAAGDNGALWLAASQSVSEKGNRPKPREHLMRLVSGGGGYKVEAKVRFAELLDAAPDAQRLALGLKTTRDLDIEGLAWRGGALYFGVKAPLDSEGRAMIWRVADPNKLLAGDLAGSGIEVWARVRLTVEDEGKKSVPGGISDLVFVTDTGVIVGATASGTSGKHHTGILATFTRTTTTPRATVVDSFPGLRPEGIAIAPDGKHVAIVFDRGKDRPLWIERDLPLPTEDL